MMLKAKKLNTYYGLSHILFDLSFEVNEKEIVCVLGRNGVGKTTLLRTIMGLTPPRTGSINFKDEEVAGKRPYQLARRGIGYVPADRRIFPDLTVRQNLEIAQKPGTSGSNSEQWSIREVFEFFPMLVKLENRFGNQLSGGEQQILSIARAIVGNSDLLLLDEPSEGLSPLIVGDLRERLLALKNKGLSILICEQNTTFAFKLSSRGYIIDKGKILYQGTVDELNSDEKVKDCLAI